MDTLTIDKKIAGKERPVEAIKYTYCTLFDSGYASRGLAMFRSLEKHAPKPFRMFILCIDEKAYEIITALKLDSVTAIRLADVENKEPDVKASKTNRSHKEYCWSLAAIFTQHIMKNYAENTSSSAARNELVIYLDSDLYFYSPLEPIYKLFGNNSTLIIPHRQPDREKTKQQEIDFGKYNVGMMVFRNDEDGKSCLTWWRDRVVEWCYDKIESTRFGDQKYLDYFSGKFKGVYVLEQKGSNLAGWCIATYTGKIKALGAQIYIDGDILIFFHFSQFKFYYPPSLVLPEIIANGYQFDKPSLLKTYIYAPYKKALYAAMDEMRKIEPGFSLGAQTRPPLGTQIREIIIPSIVWQTKEWLRPGLKPVITRTKLLFGKDL